MGCRSNGLSELWAVGIMLRFPTSLPQSDIDHNIQPATTYHVISDDDDFQLTTSNQNLSTVPTADSDDEFQPVNTSVAVKSRTSTPENSNNGPFLDSDIIIDIVPNASETSIPRGKKENQYFVIDTTLVLAIRASKQRYMTPTTARKPGQRKRVRNAKTTTITS